MELIEKDLRKYKITDWKPKAMETSDWKKIFREAHDQQI
jgi:hypothetical protein